MGKSTLLRLLFYSMGYPVPSTKGILFSKVICVLKISTEQGDMEIKRDNYDVELILNDNVYYFSLPSDLEELHTIIFGTSNKSVVSNIIGSIYLDQEKGWTLLNKGIVIGRINFNLSQLVAGLANRDIKDLEAELLSVTTELKKYKTMKNLYDYQTTLIDIADESTSDDYIDELERDLNVLLFEKILFQSK